MTTMLLSNLLPIPLCDVLLLSAHDFSESGEGLSRYSHYPLTNGVVDRLGSRSAFRPSPSAVPKTIFTAALLSHVFQSLN